MILRLLFFTHDVLYLGKEDKTARTPQASSITSIWQPPQEGRCKRGMRGIVQFHAPPPAPSSSYSSPARKFPPTAICVLPVLTLNQLASPNVRQATLMQQVQTTSPSTALLYRATDLNSVQPGAASMTQGSASKIYPLFYQSFFGYKISLKMPNQSPRLPPSSCLELLNGETDKNKKAGVQQKNMIE